METRLKILTFSPQALMLYTFLKLLFKLAQRFFFYKVEITGKEYGQENGPLLIVSNHPATLMDPIVIAANVKPRVHFLAKAVVFTNRVISYFMRSVNMIPIYRAQDNPDLVDQNEKTFGKCFLHLEKKGTILIFPEGISQSVRQVLKMKTGAARIALGAEARNGFQLGVRILPVGLNYSNVEKFRSRLFIAMGEPIEVDKYRETWDRDNKEAVRELTDEIRERIESQVVDAGNERIDLLVDRIERLIKSDILSDWGVSRHDLKEDHAAVQRISEAVKYFQARDPIGYSTMEQEINEYFDSVQNVPFPENIFRSKPLTPKSLVGYLSYFILGFPLFLFGFINNFLPYVLSRFLARKIADSREFLGALGFAFGTVIFLVFYIFEFYAIYRLTDLWWVGLIYILTVPSTGVFSFYYFKKLRRFYYKVVFARGKNRGLVSLLINRRQHIIQKLDEYRKKFEARDQDSSSVSV